MINFYVISKKVRLKRKALSDSTMVSTTKKEYGFAAMVKCNMLKLSFVWNLFRKEICTF